MKPLAGCVCGHDYHLAEAQQTQEKENGHKCASLQAHSCAGHFSYLGVTAETL